MSISFGTLVRRLTWIWKAPHRPQKAWIYHSILPFALAFAVCIYLCQLRCTGGIFHSSDRLRRVRYLVWKAGHMGNCIILAIGVAVCTLSYYNAYGFILCSIFFFGITLFMEAKQQGNYGDFAKKGLLVCVIVMILAAWWFVRNAILYDGFGMNASSICAEKYANWLINHLRNRHHRWQVIPYGIC